MTNHLCISVHAPWAWALIFAGKDVENRALNFPRKRGGESLVGRRIWVQASSWPGKVSVETCFKYMFAEFADVKYRLKSSPRPHQGGFISLAMLNEMRGHIIGSVEFYGYRLPDNPPDSPWYVPPSLAVMVRNPKPLAVPVKCGGALGVWTAPEDVAEELEKQTR